MTKKLKKTTPSKNEATPVIYGSFLANLEVFPVICPDKASFNTALKKMADRFIDDNLGSCDIPSRSQAKDELLCLLKIVQRLTTLKSVTDLKSSSMSPSEPKFWRELAIQIVAGPKGQNL